MNPSTKSADTALTDTSNGALQSARNELSRAHQALERAGLNLSQADTQTALRAAEFHTSLALVLMRGKQ